MENQEEQLVAAVTNTIGQRQSNRNWKPPTNSSVLDYLKAVVVVISCTLVAYFMSRYFDLSNVVMAYLLGVVIVSSKYSRGPAILASVLSVAAFDFFFVPPKLTFVVSDTQYLVTFVVMLVVALVISTLTLRIRQQAEAAMIREVRTAALYSMNRELASTLDRNSLIITGLRHISEVFICRTALFLATGNNQLTLAGRGKGIYALESPDFGVALWVYENKQAAGIGTNTLPGASALYIPILGANRTIGILAVAPEIPNRFMAPDQMNLLEAFGNQMAVACERSLLSDENEQARLQVKSEQLRNSLLSSVSHDLRTPLATITGAASSVLEGTERMDLASCRAMVKEIYDESIRLNRIVSNLLDMTKLQSGTLTIVKQLHSMEEIVGSALSCLEDRLVSHSIKTVIPVDLPFVLVDAMLIQQVLVNLIENALKYTPERSLIEVSAACENGTVVVAVADNGPGIPASLREKIFEKFFRESSTERASGFGLGLAICAAIVEAHGGRIRVDGRAGGGAIFKFDLEVGTPPPELERIDPEEVVQDSSDG